MKAVFGSFALNKDKTKAIPIPISVLKSGPATVAVIAISPKPRFTIATSEVMSPRELPHAIIVKARTAGGIGEIKPKS